MTKVEYRVYQIVRYTDEGFRIEAVPEHPHDQETKPVQGSQFPKKLAEFLAAMGTGGWQLQTPLIIPQMNLRSDGQLLIFSKTA